MKQRLTARLRGGWDMGLTREEERRLLLCSFAFTFFWGLLAHAYGFLNGSFSHDALNALFADGVETYWKLQLGRFGTVVYRRLFRVPLALPWLLGVLSLFWTSLAVYLTGRLFAPRSVPGLLLTAGIYTVNLSVIAMTATYLYEMDMNMFALLLAAAAVFLWDRFGWGGTVLGALLTAAVLSLYQSYVSVVLGLLLLFCIWQLLRGKTFREVFFPGLRSLIMVGAGGGLYYALLRLMVRWKDIPLDTGSYNSVYTALEPGQDAPGLFETLRAVYRDFGAAFLDPAALHLSAGALRLHLILLVLTAVLLLWFLLRGRTGFKEKLLLVALTALLPLGLNAARLFSGRDVHDLMKYAFWLVYLLPLLLAETVPGERLKRPARALIAVLALLLLWSNVQTANAVYVKKNLEYDASLSLMTRVLGRLEGEADYEPGETPLVFVGADGALNESIYGFEAYGAVTGAEFPNVIPYSDVSYFYNAYAAYFKYVLNTRVRMAEPDQWMALQRDVRVADMPAYPGQDCIRELDGVWVVKLGEPVEWNPGKG